MTGTSAKADDVATVSVNVSSSFVYKLTSMRGCCAELWELIKIWKEKCLRLEAALVFFEVVPECAIQSFSSLTSQSSSLSWGLKDGEASYQSRSELAWEPPSMDIPASFCSLFFDLYSTDLTRHLWLAEPCRRKRDTYHVYSTWAPNWQQSEKNDIMDQRGRTL